MYRVVQNVLKLRIINYSKFLQEGAKIRGSSVARTEKMNRICCSIILNKNNILLATFPNISNRFSSPPRGLDYLTTVFTRGGGDWLIFFVNMSEKHRLLY